MVADAIGNHLLEGSERTRAGVGVQWVERRRDREYRRDLPFLLGGRPLKPSFARIGPDIDHCASAPRSGFDQRRVSWPSQRAGPVRGRFRRHMAKLSSA